jgi:hypothetical protein
MAHQGSLQILESFRACRLLILGFSGRHPNKIGPGPLILTWSLFPNNFVI